MSENNFVGCLSQLCGGDMQGLRQIYEEYCPMIYSSVLQICKSPHLAEDITSEFFLRLKKAAAVYRKGLGHKKYLREILQLILSADKAGKYPQAAVNRRKMLFPISLTAQTRRKKYLRIFLSSRCLKP